MQVQQHDRVTYGWHSWLCRVNQPNPNQPTSREREKRGRMIKGTMTSSLGLMLGVAFAAVTIAQAINKENLTEARTLREWMQDHGAYLNPNLIVTDISPTTLSRGLTAVAPIKAGEALFKIPGPILYTDAKAKGTYGKDFFTAIKKTKKGDQHISDFHWTVGVALAAERAKGNDSEYKTWIDSLPQRCPNPWCAPDIEELARIPYNAGFEDPLPLSAGVWVQLAKTSYASYQRAERIVEALSKLDVPTEDPKKRSWWGEKPKKKGCTPEAKYFLNLTASDVLWGMGMVSSRNWRTQNSYEDAERLGLPYLLMIPYVDMPNHSQTSDSSLMVTNAEVEIKPVEESFDNLEPFLYVLKAGEDYAPGQEIFITYKGGNARTQDILWVFEYGMVIPGNEHSEFVLTIKLDTNLYPKMAEVVDAANVAGLSTAILAEEESGTVSIRVSLRMDLLIPPWYWGLARALYVATKFSKLDESDEDKVMQLEAEFADMIDIKVITGQERAVTSKFDATTIKMVRGWIENVFKSESKGSYNIDRFLDQAGDMFSNGKDMEGIYLLMHYNGFAAVESAGLRVLEKNTIMLSRVFEVLSNEQGEFNVVSKINKFSFAGPDWKKTLAIQENAQPLQPKSSKKKDADYHGEL